MAHAAQADAVAIDNAAELLARLAFFGRYQNHAVRAARPVNGCCRDVFQHLNRLNVVGVDRRERIQAALNRAQARARVGRVLEIDEAVNHVERLVARIHRVTAADADVAVGARLSAACRNGQSRNLSAQSLVNRWRRRAADGFGFDRGHAARQLRAFLRAVAHNNHLAQLVQVLCQLNLNGFRCLVHVDFLRAVAHKLNQQRERKFHFCFEREVAVKVGHRAQFVARCRHNG